MIEIEKVNIPQELMKLKGIWNSLLFQNTTNEIFMTFEWVQAWCEAFSEKKNLVMLVGRRDNEIVGLAPFLIQKKRRYGVNYRALKFLAQGDYADIIAKEKDREAFLEGLIKYIMGIAKNWDVLELYHIPEKSATLELMREIFEAKGLVATVKRNIACPVMYLKDDAEFARKCLKKKSLVRHFNYFKKNGDLSFTVVKGHRKIEKHMKEFFSQHTERRALAGDTSLFLDESQRYFFSRLIDLIPQERIHFSVLRYNEIPIAYHFGFLYNDKLIWYKPTFNVEYAKHSPGEVLLFYLIKEAIEKKCNEFDFTIGNEEFKQRFSNKVRYNYKIEHIAKRRYIIYWGSLRLFKTIYKLFLSRLAGLLKIVPGRIHHLFF